jgi:hypothetical protein
MEKTGKASWNEKIAGALVQQRESTVTILWGK